MDDVEFFFREKYDRKQLDSKGMAHMVETIATQLKRSASSPVQRKVLGMDDGWENSLLSQIFITMLLTAQHPKTIEELATR